ncbi:MAG: PAS domain-containing protein [Armatimonadetes bacterium]|nr:PAS domain-containing protein [Armatimonadota bacterium]
MSRRLAVIVGIGASAGGLEACESFFSAFPLRKNVAFVVVLHLDPTHESQLAHLLGKSTDMEVVQLAQQQAVEPGRVYVIAPGTSLSLRNGVLVPGKPREPRGHERPVDSFFSSLAEDMEDRAVGIVLSGTGSDGSAGLQDIKAAGGLCLVQDPESAKYDGMPRSAVATGVADHILAPPAMARFLLEYVEHWVGPETESSEGCQSTEHLEAILDELTSGQGLDFRAYRKAMLGRRIERRMALLQIPRLEDYLQHLRQHSTEAVALTRDLLIGVTRFFRDARVWAHLEKEVVPGLVDRCDPDMPLRAWVVGCATGQEAYSLAILILEQLQARGRRTRPQLFATDLNADAIDFARRGLYPATIAADVSEERLSRFFHRQGEHFRVGQRVRDCVTFAVHNLLTDPPFSHLHLATCRNLLIYLEPHAQDKVLALLHFALCPGGLLLLGTSEAAQNHLGPFDTVSEEARIYRAAELSGGRKRPPPNWTRDTGQPGRPAISPAPRGTRDLAKQVQQIVLSRYTSACVVTNTALEVLYFFGPTQDYLAQPTGAARLDLLSWVRPGLYPRLRAGLKEAIDTRHRVTLPEMCVERDGEIYRIECRIDVIPTASEEGDLMVVSFRDLPPLQALESPLSDALLASQLHQELADMRRQLQGTIEELEGSQEALLTTNEELQSTNEELMASQEEQQSLNQELITVNRQLEETNAELRSVNTDVQNLLNSTHLPTVFLDRDFRIKGFTPASTELIPLGPADVGRSLEDIKLRFSDERLFLDARKVLAEGSGLTAEVWNGAGRCYVRKALPYRTDDNRVEGVCLTFQDVTELKQVHHEIQQARVFAEAVVETIQTPLLVLQADLHVRSANDAFFRTFGVRRQDTVGRKVFDIGDGRWDTPALRKLLEMLGHEREGIRDYQVELEFEHIGLRNMCINGYGIESSDASRLILLSFEDVTERRQTEHKTRQRAEDLAQSHQRKDEFLAMLGHELRNPLSGLSHGLELLGMVRDDAARAEDLRQMMVRQTDRITGLVDQMLDVARAMSGKIAISRQPVDLADCAQAAVETIGPILEARRHELTISFPPEEELLVLGDGHRLTQVLENLLMNAAKYTEDGGQIWLLGQGIEDTVEIRVRDTGMGIDAELLPDVFELFTQDRRALHRSQGGLGLGLPLVRRLVELHGGKVRVHCPERGSEFVVTLPRLFGERPPQKNIVRSEPQDVPSHKILVVDDELMIATALTGLLRKQGHQARVVSDGAAALEAARAFQPEVVLLDLGLPDLDGYEVARRLREEHRDRKMLLIALTGYGRDEARLRESGFDEHLIKPPDLKKLGNWLCDLHSRTF